MLTSMLTADSPVRYGMAYRIPRLSRGSNELDGSFELQEGPYTFEYELRAKEILEAGYTLSKTTPPGPPPSHASNVPLLR